MVVVLTGALDLVVGSLRPHETRTLEMEKMHILCLKFRGQIYIGISTFLKRVR